MNLGFSCIHKQWGLCTNVQCNQNIQLPFSTIIQIYHCVSWLSYKYYWSIYQNTRHSVVMLTPQPCTPGNASITTIVGRITPNTSAVMMIYNQIVHTNLCLRRNACTASPDVTEFKFIVNVNAVEMIDLIIF